MLRGRFQHNFHVSLIFYESVTYLDAQDSHCILCLEQIKSQTRPCEDGLLSVAKDTVFLRQLFGEMNSSTC